jgi:hypothetical protein
LGQGAHPLGRDAVFSFAAASHFHHACGGLATAKNCNSI